MQPIHESKRWFQKFILFSHANCFTFNHRFGNRLTDGYRVIWSVNGQFSARFFLTPENMFKKVVISHPL